MPLTPEQQNRLDELERKFGNTSNLTPEQQERLEMLEAKFNPAADPSTPSPTGPPIAPEKPSELPKALGILGGIGVGGLYGSTFGPLGTLIGMTVGGFGGGAAGKGYQQGYNLGVLSAPEQDPAIPFSKLYTEQLIAGIEGGATGLSAALPEVMFPAKGLALSAQTLGAGQAIKTGISLAGKRALVAGGSTLPFNYAQTALENPENTFMQNLGGAGVKSAYYGGSEALTSGLSSGWAIKKGVRTNAKMASYVKDADQLQKFMQEIGAPEFVDAQLRNDSTVKNQAFNILKGLFYGGESLKNLTSGQKQFLLDRTGLLLQKIDDGMSPDRILRELEIGGYGDELAMSMVNKPINTAAIKQKTGIATVEQIEQLGKVKQFNLEQLEKESTKKLGILNLEANQKAAQISIASKQQTDKLLGAVGKTIDDVRVEAGDLVGIDLPIDGAQRSKVFTKLYEEDLYPQITNKVRTDTVSKAAGIATEKPLSSGAKEALSFARTPEQLASVRKAFGLTAEGGDTLESVTAEAAREMGYSTDLAKRLVKVVPLDGISFKEAHALKSALGKARFKATDANAARIIGLAQSELDKQMEVAAMASGKNTVKLWRNTDTAYNKSQLFDSLSEQYINFTKDTAGDLSLKTQGFKQYLRKNEKELMSYGLDEKKTKSMFGLATDIEKTNLNTASELAKTRTELTQRTIATKAEKIKATQTITRETNDVIKKITRENKNTPSLGSEKLKGLPDNTPIEKMLQIENELELKLLASNDTPTRISLRKTLDAVRTQITNDTKAAGTYDKYKTVKGMIDKDRLHNKIVDIMGGKDEINGKQLLNYLDDVGNKDSLINDYKLSPELYENYRKIARALSVVEGKVPTGTSAFKMMQMAAMASPLYTGLSAGLPTFMVATGGPKAAATYLAHNPYILESVNAAKILAKGLQQGGKSEQVINVLGKAYAAWLADDQRPQK